MWDSHFCLQKIQPLLSGKIIAAPALISAHICSNGPSNQIISIGFESSKDSLPASVRFPWDFAFHVLIGASNDLQNIELISSCDEDDLSKGVFR